MLKGYHPNSIVKTLNVCNATVYNDIKCLTKKSKQYVYDLAKGTHVLMYQRAIEGIALTLENAWLKFNDPKVPEKQKVGYLKLTMEANESMIDLTANGPTVIAIRDLIRRANSLGIDTSNYKPLALTEDQQVRNYMSKNYVNGSDIGANNNNNSNEVI